MKPRNGALQEIAEGRAALTTMKGADGTLRMMKEA